MFTDQNWGERKIKYCILTPVAPHKRYARDLYWGGVNGLSQAPTQTIIHAKQEVYSYWIERHNEANTIWDIEPDNAITRLVPGTTKARESLRKAFLDKGDLEWALWLDCDIVPPPDMIDKFEAFHADHPTLVMLVAHHPCRTDMAKIRHGISCTFVHRDAMMAHPFTVATIRGQNLGDDQIWLFIIHQFSRRRNIEVFSGLYFDVKHAHEDGRIKEFDEEDKMRLLL